MKNARNILLLSILCLFVSCKKDTASVNLLTEAQKTVKDKPSEALALLDSIADPQNMEQESYMQYIVTRVQAKVILQQDVTGDTLIFEAQKYFDLKNNPEQAALAGYYTGIVNREIKRYDQSLTSFLKSAEYAKKAADDKLLGKIFDYIGYVYLEQGLMDSAIVNYQKAINHYTIEKNAPYILRVTNQIGRAYEHVSKLDSAYIYFISALQMAESLNDEWYISNITQNLGLTSFGMDEYDEAIEYYKSALDMQATTDTQKRQIYLYLLNIYNNKQDAHLAKECAAKLEASLPDVTNIHTKKEMYAALADYYKLTADYKQALHYEELEEETVRQIVQVERPAEMIKADSNFRIEQKSRFYKELESNFYFYLSLGVIAIIITWVFIVIAIRQRKKEKEYFRSETEEYQKYKEHFEAMSRDYDRIDAEIKSILEGTGIKKE